MKRCTDQGDSAKSSFFTKRQLGFFAALVMTAGFILLAIGAPFPSVEEGMLWLDALLTWLRDRPAILIAATAVLPGAGVPVSPLLVAIGAVAIPRYGMVPTCLFAWLSISICMIWNYWLARCFFRGFTTRIIASRQHLLPEGDSSNFTILAILIRITPGIPLVVQNYFLGFMKMPLKKYLLISLIVQAIYTPAYVISGGALMEGKFKLFILALLAIAILSVATYSLRHRLEKFRKA